jgi:BirA family biotin operon repressor/biotin-[acetyl-CoA-carboxylase] ligase
MAVRFTAPPRCTLEHMARVGSTNTEVLERGRAGAAAALWIVADEQTAGRGRHGRRWTSPPGNLYASRLVGGAAPPARFAQLSFVAGHCVHDAAAQLLSERAAEALWLKWPNDLMVGQAKLSGVLIESETVGQGIIAAVGIGLNLISGAEAPGTISLKALGSPVGPADAFEAVSKAFERRLAQWGDGRGFARIRQDWAARAAALGTAVSVRLGEEVVAGAFGGIEADGALVLTMADGRTRRISAGDVLMSGVSG